MTQTVYGLGYGGRQLADIRQIVDDLDAYLVDIRFVPHSEHPDFRRAALEKVFGDRFIYLHAFGNRNYKRGGPVELVDYETGRTAITALDRPAIILCGCKDATHCHRTTILNRLTDDGFTVQEWTAANPSDPQQLTLW